MKPGEVPANLGGRPGNSTGSPRSEVMLTAAPGAPLVPVVPELDPRLSRIHTAPDGHGVARTWHLLDTHPDSTTTTAEDPGSQGRRDDRPEATLVCVHGNPTWSYLWRRVIGAAPSGWRVIAPDHLGMGYSEQLDEPRTLAERVADLGALIDSLAVSGPVYLLAHDWGGPIGLGWAGGLTTDSSQPRWLAGVVLTNTAVHQPTDAPEPAAIRLAHTPGLRGLLCRTTPAFVRATTTLSRGSIEPAVRNAYAAPYRSRERRTGVADFVADIPFRADHRSAPALDRIAERVSGLEDTPALLVWGMRDPVFAQRYLQDLRRRLPHADVQRYPDASHLVLEDAPEGVEVIWTWLEQTRHERRRPVDPNAADDPRGPERVQGVPIEVNLSRPDQTAIVELGPGGRQITFAGLAERVAAMASGLSQRGVRPGQRVAVLVPPGIDLTTLVYALWRVGAVVVIADAGLGVRRLGGALRGAAPDHLIAIRRGIVLAGAARVPGRHHRFEPADAVAIAKDGLRAGPLEDVTAGHPTTAEAIGPEADGVILFTSGATGPPKGVVYSRERLSAQVALLQRTFDLRPGTRFVAAFAPFALYGAALGLPSAVPDMDVTAPHTLTAAALARAAQRIDAEVVFASPAALRNVVATAADLAPDDRVALARIRLLLSAGAPVPPALLRRLRTLLPEASMQTPYGMTEALPVATIDPTESSTPTSPDRAGSEDRDAAQPEGVCVGRPLDGVMVRVAPLDIGGTPLVDADPEAMTGAAHVLGEVVVRGPHTKSRYDGLWATHRDSEQPPGWHRTGDVGAFDDEGRLWIQGRLAHLIRSSAGPIAPYGIEQRVEAIDGVEAAAAVGVGPAGTQQVVVVVVPDERLPRLTGTPLAPGKLADQVRAAAADGGGVRVAAVLQRDWLPVDVRHASKVDRHAVAVWATRWLHGQDAAKELQVAGGRAPATKSR